jgi:hypothetical protein
MKENDGFVTNRQIQRLRGDGPPCHLDRYQLAHTQKTSRALDVRCPFCEVGAKEMCIQRSRRVVPKNEAKL